jgi:RND family efflux transporter MFP subunit
MTSLVEYVFQRGLDAAPRASGSIAEFHAHGCEPTGAELRGVHAGQSRQRWSTHRLLIACATALGVVGLQHYLNGPGAAQPVRVVAAKPVRAPEQLLLNGETAAWHRSTIYARVNGYVARWYVDMGDRVRQGEVLCELETPELDNELAAARAQLRASRTQVLIREADAAFARNTYERWRDSPRGAVSEQERAAKRADYAAAAGRLQVARAQVLIDQQRVDEDAALSALKQVTAPFDGVIVAREADIGVPVTAGDTGASVPLYQLIQDDPVRVLVRAPQSIAPDLMRAGLPARVLLGEGAQGRAYDGKVARTAGAFDDRTRTLQIEVDLPNPTHELVPGMQARVAFSVPPRGAVEVPGSGAALAMSFKP